MNKRLIYTINKINDPDCPIPFPPLCTLDNTDYCCLTNNNQITSKYYKLIFTEELDDLENRIVQLMPGYSEYVYIEPDSIIIDSDNNEPILLHIPSIFPYSTDKDLHNIKCIYNNKYNYEPNIIPTDGPYEGRPYLLSIGFPVSNQISTIERCLSHLMPLLDAIPSELVIADTGSTDGTREICERYGAKIIDFPWCDNMSAARNICINNASGLWYMSVDDDEWFEDVTPIIEFFTSGEYKNYTFAEYVQRNYLYVDDTDYLDFPTSRMGVRTSELHFEGRIHDSLTDYGTEGAYIPAVSHHYGFAYHTKEDQLKKYYRNIKLLIRDICEYPLNIRYLFQLAKEFNIIDMHDLYFAFIIKTYSISLNIDNICNKNTLTDMILSLPITYEDRLIELCDYCLRKYNYSTMDAALINAIRMQSAFRHGKLEDIYNIYYPEHISYEEKILADEARSLYNSIVGMNICKSADLVATHNLILYLTLLYYNDKNATIYGVELTDSDISNNIDFFTEHNINTLSFLTQPSVININALTTSYLQMTYYRCRWVFSLTSEIDMDSYVSYISSLLDYGDRRYGETLFVDKDTLITDEFTAAYYVQMALLLLENGQKLHCIRYLKQAYTVYPLYSATVKIFLDNLY